MIVEICYWCNEISMVKRHWYRIKKAIESDLIFIWNQRCASCYHKDIPPLHKSYSYYGNAKRDIIKLRTLKENWDLENKGKVYAKHN